MDLNEYRKNLNTFCSHTIEFICDLVNKLKYTFQEKLDDFVDSFKYQLNLQQKNFIMVKNDLDYKKIFNELKLQVKNKIDSLQNINQQLFDLNGLIIIQPFVKFNTRQTMDTQYASEIENFNKNQLQVQQSQDFQLADQQEQVREMVRAHADRWLNKLLYTCYECKFQFIGILKFRLHLRAHHEVQNLYKCGYCNEQFQQTTFMSIHCFKSHSYILYDRPVSYLVNKRIYDCPYTKSQFTQQVKLAQHFFRTLQYHTYLPNNFKSILKKERSRKCKFQEKTQHSEQSEKPQYFDITIDL